MIKRVMGIVSVFVLLFSVVAQAEEPKPQAGYAGGFFLQSDDGAFNLKIKGKLVTRFQFKDSTVSDPALSFLVRNASLTFKAVIKEKTTFNFGLTHATNSQNFDSVNVSGVTLSQEIIPEFSVAIGMVGLPLDLGGAGGLLTDAPIVYTQADGSEPFAVTRESFGAPGGLGLNLSGGVGRFSYSWSVVNGAESDYQVNSDKKFSTGASVSFNILEAANAGNDYAHSEKPALTIGVGGTYQGKRTDTAFAEAFDAADLEDGSDDDLPAEAPVIRRMFQFSGGESFCWKGLSIQSDFYWRMTKFSNFGDLPVELQDPNLTDFGYVGGVSYFIMPKKFEVAATVSQIFREGPDNNGNQLGAGLNYYVKGENLKAQLAYFWSEDYDDILGTKNNKAHKAVLQLQTKF